ncbi:hypothetical protein GAGA_0311 [Paraglaciecola agarilytica NO2]|uniref:Uncharacterized protein n=1 Tax=Paraglaciecola agarilytica NO2 TaxID=1125747 RepID=A0ABQ0I1I5_9ALTE|nr:hypothetical protein GAGA_0311 [Paraglaciecola agarilytica NO2]
MHPINHAIGMEQYISNLLQFLLALRFRVNSFRVNSFADS